MDGKRHHSLNELSAHDLIVNTAVAVVTALAMMLAFGSILSGNVEFGVGCIGLAGFIWVHYGFRRAIQWLNWRDDPIHQRRPPDPP
jgi:hypothetical protein